MKSVNISFHSIQFIIDTLKLIILLNQAELIENGMHSELIMDERICSEMTTLMRINYEQFRDMLCNRVLRVGTDTLIVENSQ